MTAINQEALVVGKLQESVTSTATTLIVKFNRQLKNGTLVEEGMQLSSKNFVFTLDRENNNFEYVYVEAGGISYNATTKITTLTSVERGLKYDGSDLTGITANKKTHTSNASVELATEPFSINEALQTIVADASTTDKGLVEIATQSEFDAGTDTGGTGAKLTALPSQIQGSLPSNASTTVKGLVEIATQAQFDAGTDTGETGAKLMPLPSQIQGAIPTVNDASDTVKGIVEIATQAQFDAGTDTGETGAKLTALPSQIQGSLSNVGSVNLEFGENIDGTTTPQAVCINERLYQSLVNTVAPTGSLDITVNDQDVVATNFLNNAGYPIDMSDGAYIHRVSFKLTQLGTSGDLMAQIWAMDALGNNITSHVANSNTLPYSGQSTGVQLNFTFSTPVLMPYGTYYAIALKRISGAGTHRVGANSSVSSGFFDYYVSSNGGTSWVKTNGNITAGVYVYNAKTSKVMKTNTGDSTKDIFLGFVEDNITSGSNGNIIRSKNNKISGFSSLWPGEKYGISTADGVIQVVATDADAIAQAISETELLIL